MGNFFSIFRLPLSTDRIGTSLNINAMKKILFLLFSLSVFTGKAQNFEGIITWKISTEITDPKMKAQMEQAQKQMKDPATQAQMKEMQEKMNDPEFKKMMESNPQMKAQMEAAMKMMQGGDMNSMMPSGFVLKLKNKNILTKFDGGVIKMETLYLSDKGASYSIDREAKTYSNIPEHKEDPNNKVDIKVTKTSETANILNYPCTKYLVDITTRGQTMQQVIWTTTAIKDIDFKALSKYKVGDTNAMFYGQLDGVPLKTEMTAPQGKMLMEVTEIKKQSLPSSDFEIPSGYKEVPFAVFK
jgi:hypothetical protein